MASSSSPSPSPSSPTPVGELIHVQCSLEVAFASGDTLRLTSPALSRADLTEQQVLAFVAMQVKEHLGLLTRKFKARRETAEDFAKLAPEPIPADLEG